MDAVVAVVDYDTETTLTITWNLLDPEYAISAYKLQVNNPILIASFSFQAL